MFQIEVGKYKLVAERTGEYAIESDDIPHPIHTGREKSLRKAQEAGLAHIQKLLDGLRKQIDDDLRGVKIKIKAHNVAFKALAKLQKQLKRQKEDERATREGKKKR